MSRLRRAAPWLALVAAVVVLAVVLVVRNQPSSAPEARAARLARELRCPECQGLSVADSFERTSQAIRRDIEERIAAGQSDAEIRAAYVERYGEDILLTPEGEGIGVVVWGLPVLVLVVAGGVLGLSIARSRRRDEPERATGRRVLVVAVIAGFGVVSAVALAAAVGDRAPDGTATGNDAAGQVSPEERRAALQAAVDAAPDDYDARLALARFLLNNDLPAALEEYDAAARLRPGEPEPKAYGGWILGLVAQQVDDGGDRQQLLDGAVARLDAAIGLDETYADAYVFKGLVLFNALDDPAGAVPYFQRFLTLAPEDHPQRELVLGALARAVEGTSTTTTPGGTAPSTAAPPTTVP